MQRKHAIQQQSKIIDLSIEQASLVSAHQQYKGLVRQLRQVSRNLEQKELQLKILIRQTFVKPDLALNALNRYAITFGLKESMILFFDKPRKLMPPYKRLLGKWNPIHGPDHQRKLAEEKSKLVPRLISNLALERIRFEACREMVLATGSIVRDKRIEVALYEAGSRNRLADI